MPTSIPRIPSNTRCITAAERQGQRWKGRPSGRLFFLATPAAGRSCRGRGQKRQRPGIVSAPPDRHARQVSRLVGPGHPISARQDDIGFPRGAGGGRPPARRNRPDPRRDVPASAARSDPGSKARLAVIPAFLSLRCHARQPEAARRRGGSLSRLKAGPPSIRMAALPKSSATDAAAMSPASGKPRTTLLGGPEGRLARVLSLTSEFPAAAVASSRGRNGRKILPRNLPI